MSDASSRPSYRQLGTHLKAIRRRLHESLSEVSGAVEIGIEKLQQFEGGWQRPSEDVLMLLISHFGMQDDEAVSLWELAGYDKAERAQYDPSEEALGRQSVVMMLAVDSRVVYSDGLHIAAGPSGIVLNFTQGSNAAEQSIPVARVGMSKEQAYMVMSLLQKTLAQSTPRALPKPNTPIDKTDTRNS